MGGMKRSLLEDAERDQAWVTLGGLEEGVDIFCWCNRCGHNAVMPREVLLAQLGPDMPVPAIGARLRCSGCGSKDVATRPDWPSLGQVAHH